MVVKCADYSTSGSGVRVIVNVPHLATSGQTDNGPAVI